MRRIISIGFAAGFAVTLLAGCGSSSSTTGTPSPTVPTVSPTASASPTPVKTYAPKNAGSVTVASNGVTVKGPWGKEPNVTVKKGTKAPSKTVVKVVMPGTGPVATPDSTVTVQYAGVLLQNGKAFNSSWVDNQGAPVSFPLNQVIPGWRDRLPGMKSGGRSLFIIPASEAYGKDGRPPVIPANAALVFVVDLLAVS